MSLQSGESEGTIRTMEHRAQHRKKLYFLVFAGIVGVVATVMGGYQLLGFMDSTDFCGRLCHDVMYPEYTAYQASPHSRVECVDCHVGYSASWIVQSKISGIPQMFATLFNTYERPIPVPVENLRPARDTCERCHWPQRFAGDLVRVKRHYLADEENTEQVNTLVLRVGGGHSDTARDIHWHIGAKVWYLPLDKERQEIGWVGVEGSDAELVEYVDPGSVAEITPQRIQADKRLMDCIDCHNRATHIFYSPDELIDTGITQGLIDQSLPFIKAKGLEALNPPNSSLEKAMDKIEAIREFYHSSYPDVYAEKRESIDEAIEQLKEIARLTTFPYMEVDWKTYPNNIGHTEWPGCLRCHGKLVGTTGDQEGEIIDASCNSCHYPLSAM